MSLSYKSFAYVAKVWGTLGNNIRKNQDFFITTTLGLMVANLIVFSIQAEVAYKKQTEKMNKYVVDLEMLSKELTSDEWINSLDAKLKDSAERPQIIKIEMKAILKKCGSELPNLEVRPQERVVPVDEEEIITAPKAFPNDGGRIM